MTQTDEIKKVFEDKRVKSADGLVYDVNLDLQEIYKALPQHSPASIKATIAYNVSKNIIFSKVGRGTYSLRSSQSTPTSSPPNTTSIDKKYEKKAARKSNMVLHNDTDQEYIPRSMYGTTDVKLLNELYKNKDFVLIIGETGCGKTMLARHIAKINNVPYQRVNITGATTPEDLVGQWIPNSDATNPSKYIWCDGILTSFMRKGGVLVVDELNMACGDILSIFHSVADDERKLVITQKDGEVVIAHKDFYLICTINPDYEGTKPLNLALKDRFRVLYLSYNDVVEKKLKIDSKILDIADKLRKSEEILTPVSTRDLIKYRDDVLRYGDSVARAFFKNNFDVSEQNVVEEILGLILDNMVPKKDEQKVGGDENGTN